MYSIVMVDDEPWALEDLAKVIDWGAYGFSIPVCFTDPEEALAYIIEQKPDVVFTDIRMPVLSGIGLIEQARRAELETEFVIISSYEDFEAAKKAIHLQVCEYALKPYEEAEIMDIARMLEQRLAEKQNRICLSETDAADTLEAAKARLQQTDTAYASHMLIVSKYPYKLAEGIAEHTVPVQVKGIASAYLLSSDQMEKRLHAIAQNAPHLFGISRIHTDLLRELQQMLREALYALRCDFSFAEKTIISDIQLYICSHMAEELSLASISKEFHFSEPYFCGLFKKGTGISVIKFIQIIRVNYAAYLMEDTALSLHRISEAVGFSNYSYFGKLFKQYKGVPPESYRSALQQVRNHLEPDKRV